MVTGTTLGLAKRLAGAGFAFVPGAVARSMLEEGAPLMDWPSFAASWDSLPLDQHMADQGRYRRRRHAVYAVSAAGKIERQPHQAHYQSLDYNTLNGGIERWFEPVDEGLGKGPSVRRILGWCAGLFGSLVPDTDWHVELHQFRIEAAGFELAKPTPEGMHRDGVDYVLVLLVQRRNIDSGTTVIGNSNVPVNDEPVAVEVESEVLPFEGENTIIHAAGGGFEFNFLAEGEDADYDDTLIVPDSQDEPFVDSFTLTDPFDAALVDDNRVYHGVTPVRAHDSNKPAFRDVLVVTFRRK